jgi:arsenate reductase-like glutaredoxin family protein
MGNQIKVVSYLDKIDIIDFLQDSMDHEELVEWIKLLDESIQDWDVTVALYRHFKELKQQFNAEVKAK